MTIGSVSTAAAYMPTPQGAAAASQASSRVAAQAAAAKSAHAKAAGTDGDGDHGVEPSKTGAQGGGHAPAGTGLLLNRSA